MSEETILLIDDDETLLKLLSEHLETFGFHCRTSNSGSKGLQLATTENPDLIVLDVMMPAMDGWEVCTRLREFSQVPIIMLTAKDEEIDKLHGFRLGVDDYVTKPFSFAELTARIGAVLTRSQSDLRAAHQIKSGDLTVDFDRRQVLINDNPVDLTPTEYRLLEVLARYRNKTIPIEQLLDEVWGRGYEGQVDQVKHYIWSLRKKIERDPGAPIHIITDRGFGYHFE